MTVYFCETSKALKKETNICNANVSAVPAQERLHCMGLKAFEFNQTFLVFFSPQEAKTFDREHVVISKHFLDAVPFRHHMMAHVSTLLWREKDD